MTHLTFPAFLPVVDLLILLFLLKLHNEKLPTQKCSNNTPIYVQINREVNDCAYISVVPNKDCSPGFLEWSSSHAEFILCSSQ